MVFDISIVLTWLLYLGLFPMAFLWLRRAWKIFKKKDYSEVALKRGENPPDTAKWAPYTGAVNLIAGLTALWAIFGIALWIAFGLLIGPFNHFKSWYAIAGLTIWGKLIGDYVISRSAHPFKSSKKKKAQS